MGIIKQDDIIAWDTPTQILCVDCMDKRDATKVTGPGGDPEKATPLTEDDLEETDIVICDVCGERIQ